VSATALGLFAVKLLAAYLIGSISGSLVLGRWRRVDIRAQGSGNAGATNAFRTQGALFALGVVGIDVGKGALAAWLGMQYSFGAGALLPEPGDALAAGMAATLGHVWPVFFGFRGGKGAGTLVGCILVLMPPACVYVLGGWLLMLTTTGYVGLSTIVAGLLLPPVVAWLAPGNDAWLVFAGAASGLLLVTHRVNLARMAAGTEFRFERARVLVPRRLRKGPP
jgi:glycerol-3-phosphate acyltransferase PlsY